MEISDNLVCLYSGQVEERDGSYVVEVPKSEVSAGSVSTDRVYRVALLSTGTDEPGDDEGEAPASAQRETQRGQGPPVDEGDTRTVDIEDIGEKGDGIARVERGYVVIVPDTEQGERVTIEITDVRENMGFAEVVEREAYYE